MKNVWKMLGRLTPWLLAPVSAAIAILLCSLPFFVTMEHKTIDWRIRARAPDPSFGKDMVVVMIDEPAVKEYLYRSPLSRKLLARLIDILDAAGAKAIGLDVFLEGHTTSEDDEALVRSMQKCGRVVPVSYLRREDNVDRLDTPDIRFMNVALATGLADFPIDPIDNKVRQSQIFFDPVPIPSLSSVLYLISQGAEVRGALKMVDPTPLKDLALPMDENGRFFINYQRPSSSSGDEKDNVIQTIPASILLTGFVPPGWIKDKVVLIGAGYDDNPDTFRTPFFSKTFDYVMMPGVEIHANALATLNAGRTIRPLSREFAVALVVVLCVMLVAFECGFNTMWAFVAMMLVGAGYVFLSMFTFNRTGIALPMLSGIVGILLSFITVAVYRSLTEGGQKRWIKKAFEMYVAPSVVDSLVKRPERLFLGGEEREVTILFTDIEGFTTISEALPPQELVSLLNEYLDGMTQIVVKHDGTLDKYEGDAVVAFWGAPLTQPDHAVKAVWAALEMAKFSIDISEKFKAAKKPSINTRIGVNTGRVVVGNIGSKKHFNYTVMGDHANLASRLEGANKIFQTHVMISESTYERAKDLFLARELGRIKVKGKTQTTRVFELIGYLTAQYPPGLMEMLGVYNRAMAEYNAGNWTKAFELFDRATKVRPDDGPAAKYREHCKSMIGRRSDADGSFTLDRK